MSEKELSSPDGQSRRDFIKSSAALSMAAMSLGGAVMAAAQKKERVIAVRPGGSDTLKVGLIGCGGRGTGAMLDCIESSAGIQIYALGDTFQDRVDGAVKKFEGSVQAACNFKERCFVGFDAYQKVLASGVDMVILATPPGFRPIHFAAAVEAGKHVFMEKPVAVDPTGLRAVIEAAKKAKEKNLSVVAGTQRRHQKSYMETIKRLQDGALGDIVGGEVYWMQGGLWVKEKTAEMSEMEWQIRNWLYFDWLSGDHIVEQHVHNLDVMCWVMGGPPMKAIALGGRQVRTDAKYGNIFDHFAVEFEFANGVRIHSKCSQLEGASNNRVTERFVGTKGFTSPGGSITDFKGGQIYKFEGDQVNPYVQEHADLVKAIRQNAPINEGEQVALSTACAILGRMAAYTGNEIKFSWMLNASKLDLVPKSFEWGNNPVNPVPGPGRTKLVV